MSPFHAIAFVVPCGVGIGVMHSFVTLSSAASRSDLITEAFLLSDDLCVAPLSYPVCLATRDLIPVVLTLLLWIGGTLSLGISCPVPASTCGPVTRLPLWYLVV